eukprot:4781241-Pleurochrysis_carterae.AAC.1
MSSPAPAQQVLTPAYHPQGASRRLRQNRIESVRDGILGIARRAELAPQRVLWVARLATSHPTQVGGEWGESIERAIITK